jgi:hypothetical protein
MIESMDIISIVPGGRLALDLIATTYVTKGNNQFFHQKCNFHLSQTLPSNNSQNHNSWNVVLVLACRIGCSSPYGAPFQRFGAGKLKASSCEMERMKPRKC